ESGSMPPFASQRIPVGAGSQEVWRGSTPPSECARPTFGVKSFWAVKEVDLIGHAGQLSKQHRARHRADAREPFVRSHVRLVRPRRRIAADDVQPAGPGEPGI